MPPALRPPRARPRRPGRPGRARGGRRIEPGVRRVACAAAGRRRRARAFEAASVAVERVFGRIRCGTASVAAAFRSRAAPGDGRPVAGPWTTPALRSPARGGRRSRDPPPRHPPARADRRRATRPGGARRGGPRWSPPSSVAGRCPPSLRRPPPTPRAIRGEAAMRLPRVLDRAQRALGRGVPGAAAGVPGADEAGRRRVGRDTARRRGAPPARRDGAGRHGRR